MMITITIVKLNLLAFESLIELLINVNCVSVSDVSSWHKPPNEGLKCKGSGHTA